MSAPAASARPSEITTLLRLASNGDDEAARRLFGEIYSELRLIARRQLRRLGRSDTLQTTVLVHETFLKLSGAQRWSAEDRRHFFNLAARAMRQIVLDAARRSARDKRGGGVAHAELDAERLVAPERPEELLALDVALDRLASTEPELARLVEWRFFAGLSATEIALEMAISERTFTRRWRTARALLIQDLRAQGIATPADP